MKLPEEWLLKARHDLDSAKKLISDDQPISDTAIYHTQQCAEKSLKAFLSYNDRPVLRTHDIRVLLELCIEIDNSFDGYYSIKLQFLVFLRRFLLCKASAFNSEAISLQPSAISFLWKSAQS